MTFKVLKGKGSGPRILYEANSFSKTKDIKTFLHNKFVLSIPDLTRNTKGVLLAEMKGHQ